MARTSRSNVWRPPRRSEVSASARAAVEYSENCVGGQLRLGQEAPRRAFRDEIREVRLRVGRDQDDRRAAVPIVLDQVPRTLKPALLREHDVDEGEIRLEFPGSPERLRARQGNAHDGQALPLEEDACSLKERPVVIHNEDASRHRTSVAGGTPRRIAASRSEVAGCRVACEHGRIFTYRCWWCTKLLSAGGGGYDRAG